MFSGTSPTRGIPQAGAPDGQIPRRAVGARNARARLRAAGKNCSEFLIVTSLETIGRRVTACEINQII